MNKKIHLFTKVLTAIVLAFAFSGCLKDKLTKTYTILTPVYGDKSAVLANIVSPLPREVKAPGKIYLYGNYIFLNEIDKGVHIIDNSDPSNPRNIGFLNIPGNLDIAVKGNILYADFYTDLLAIDISDPAHGKLLKEIPGIFPERYYSNGFVPATGKVIVDWLRKDTVVDVQRNNSGPIYWDCANCVFLTADRGAPQAKASVPGISGSMARFTIVNDYLYAVDRHTLTLVSLNNPSDPELGNSINAGYDIETIYPFQDKLFLGSMGGLFIYDISNPGAPVKLSDFQHARACDPVVSDGNYAFVTLRKGTYCGPTDNQLLVIDVKNITAPVLLKAYEMSNPFGLSVDGNTLFVCDGEDGLKIYDASNVQNLKMIKHMTVKNTYDAIAWGKRLLLVSESGIQQYDYSDLSQIKLLSTIKVN